MANNEDKPKTNPEEVTKKWGLEAGLFTALKNKEGGEMYVGCGCVLVNCPMHTKKTQELRSQFEIVQGCDMHFRCRCVLANLVVAFASVCFVQKSK
jgi:hypothetical protein